MNVEILTVGPFQVNCYIVKPDQNSDKVFVIDPGDEGDKIIRLVETKGYKPEAVLLTHAHLDHIKGCATVANHFDVKVYVPDADIPMFVSDDNEIAPWLYRDCEFPEPAALSELPSGYGFEVIQTPGHTLGGVCYYFAAMSVLFSGDTLFQQSIGRTDLPGGDTEQLLNSIKQNLLTLPADTRVYPGHGGSTVIGDEKRSNPFVR